MDSNAQSARVVGGLEMGPPRRYVYCSLDDGGLVCFIRTGPQSGSSLVASYNLSGLPVLRNDQEFCCAFFRAMAGSRDMEPWRPRAVYDWLALVAWRDHVGWPNDSTTVVGDS